MTESAETKPAADLKRMRVFNLGVAAFMLALPLLLAGSKFVFGFEAVRWWTGLWIAAGVAIAGAIVSRVTGPRPQPLFCYLMIMTSMMLGLAFLVRNHVEHPMPYMLMAVVVGSMGFHAFHFTFGVPWRAKPSG
jgi:hypothetical protein